MLTIIKNILLGIFEGIVAAKQYAADKQIHRYLSESVDHADLKMREERLKVNSYSL